jgi:hypothetical protein
MQQQQGGAGLGSRLSSDEAQSFVNYVRRELNNNLSTLVILLPNAPHADDELGKWAAFANELRNRSWQMDLDDAIIQTVSDALRPCEWSWDRADNCRCASCFAKGDQATLTKYLYVETLKRKTEWLEPSPDEMSRSKDMLRVMQDFSSTMKPNQSYGYQAFIEFRAGYPDVPWGDVDFWCQTPQMPTRLLICCAHQANEMARRAMKGDAEAREARERLEDLGLVYDDADPLKYVIEGFVEDCYCLGSRIDGHKYYVGTTNDPFRRHKEHSSDGCEGLGSKFNMRMTGCMRDGARVWKPDEYGDEQSGWWMLKHNPVHHREGHRASSVNDEPNLHNRLDELNRMLTLCFKHGQRHVRGSVMSTSKGDHPERQRELIEVIRREQEGLCFKCGRRKHGQCEDDDGVFGLWYGRSIAAAVFELAGGSDVLSMMHRTPLTAGDNRTVANGHMDRMCRLAEAVAQRMDDKEVLSLDAVVVKETVDANNNDNAGGSNSAGGSDGSGGSGSSGGGGGAELTPAQLYALVDSSRDLRPKQEEALARILLPTTTTMLVQLPTAYGKTSIALGCAVHEIVCRDGRVVMFVPTIALMNDMMKTMEEITIARLGHVEKFPINPYLKKSDYYSVYGGDFDVPGHPGKQIRWRRWQGASQDNNMSIYQKRPDYTEGNLIFATPDKWMSSSDRTHTGCDAFVKLFRERAREFGMLIIDEAHTFDSVLGGHTCHLIERMDRLRQNRNGLGRLRIVMNSATVPGADEFMRKLVGDQRGNALVKVTAEESDQPLVFKGRDLLLQASQAWASNSRRRLLLFHAGAIRPMDCTYLLHSGPLQEHQVRRVVYFVDSLNKAKASMRDFQSARFAARAGWARDAISVTPYHGDVPTGTRTCAEHMFGKWLERPHLHIIVATSALEMGVNLQGLDMVIVSSKQHCEVSSLLQRIGRTGRQNGCPGLVIIGGDVQTEEDARKCLELNDELIVVVKTKAMRLHSELRELQNDSSGYLDGHLDIAVQNQSIEAKRREGLLETTMFDEMSTRGISSPKINIVRATASGGIMRPQTNWTEDGADGEDGTPDYEVPIVRLDAMRALELACPGSHCRTSFGGLVYCLNPRFKGELPRPNELNWLPRVDSIPAFKLTPMDEKHYFHSKATWDRIPSLVAGAGDEQLTGMSVFMVWRSTLFTSIYNDNIRILERPPRGGGEAGYHFYARGQGVDGLNEPPQVQLPACGFRCGATFRLGEDATVQGIAQVIEDRLNECLGLPRGLLHALVHGEKLYVFELAGIGVAKYALDRMRAHGGEDGWLAQLASDPELDADIDDGDTGAPQGRLAR